MGNCIQRRSRRRGVFTCFPPSPAPATGNTRASVGVRVTITALDTVVIESSFSRILKMCDDLVDTLARAIIVAAGSEAELMNRTPVMSRRVCEPEHLTFRSGLGAF